MDRNKYEQIFYQESGRYLQDLEDMLMQVEKDTRNRALWGEIHGKIHSIKGMARALSLEKITNLSHAMEEWCQAFQNGGATADARTIQAIYDGADSLRRLVACKGRLESFEDQHRYGGLMSLFEKDPSGRTEKAVALIPLESSVSKQIQVASIKEVRVHYSLIEELLGLAQELQLLEKSLPPVPRDQSFVGFRSWLDHCTSLMKVIYFRLVHLRLMSVGDFAGLFRKTIRNLAASHGKEVQFVVEGQEIEADITILERLREPLVHILRNCIAHGIETPSERRAAGKPGRGRIFIKAVSERDNLLMCVGDDGRGINRSAIIDFIKRHEGLTEDEIKKRDDVTLYNTILSPDYSSCTQADELAGRGIGMRVVAQAISYLGGTLKINSAPGKGSEFYIRLPLSMSIVQAISFEVDGYTLSIPTHRVAAINRIGNLAADDLAGVIHLGELLKIGNQSNLLHVISLKSGTEEDVSNRGQAESLIGVDTIVGNRPLMVLPVGELLATTGAYSGVGIMENGEIAMMLDLSWIVARITTIRTPFTFKN